MGTRGMHPDDLRAKDHAWLRGTTPRLPRLISKTPLAYVGFDGEERHSGTTGVKCASERWAAEPDLGAKVAHLRLELLLSWPDSNEVMGSGLEPYIHNLEIAVEEQLGLREKAPAVSRPNRGEAASGLSRPTYPSRADVRARQAKSAERKLEHAYRRQERTDSTPAESVLRSSSPLKERSRAVERRFAARGIRTEPMKHGGGMAVRVTDPPEGMHSWTYLTEAEQWLDNNPAT